MILGTTYAGPVVNLPTAEVWVRQIDIPDGGMHLAFLGALLDGLGPGSASGTGRVAPVVYDEDGRLLATGPEVVVGQSASRAWWPLRLALPGMRLTGSPWIGFRTSGPNNALRISTGLTPSPPAKHVAAASGPPADLDDATASTVDGAVFADVFAPWLVPQVPDAQLARLPWALSQRAFAQTGPVRSSARTAACGWHGSTTDVEKSANCIVRSDGPLADLVGERLRVTRTVGTLRRSIIVFCHDEQDFPPEVADEDISLPRAAFLRIAPPPLDSITITVEVMA